MANEHVVCLRRQEDSSSGKRVCRIIDLACSSLFALLHQVLALAKTALSKYTDGKEPEVLAIHAGLECGLIGERIPGADMVSFGPTIAGALSPDEAVKIDTVPPFFSTVMDTLEALAAKA